MDDGEIAELIGEAESALARLQELPGPGSRTANEAVEALARIYGEGLARVVSLVNAQAPEVTASLTADDLVGHLLLLHGLHPEPVELRVERALDEVRPYLEAHGTEVRLRRVDGRVAHVRISETGSGCGSSPRTTEEVVEEALGRWAPEIEVVEALEPSAPETLIPAEALFRRSSGETAVEFRA